MLRWFNRLLTRLLLRNINYADENIQAIHEAASRGPIVYVLAFKSVLLNAALRQAIKERGLPNAPITYLKTPRTLLSSSRSRTEDELTKLATQQRAIDKQLVLIPHLLVLGRRRARADKSAMDLVFGSREAPGFLRLLLRMVLNKSKAHWQTGEAITLPKPDEKKSIRLQIFRQFRRLESAHIGPRAKSYNRLRNETLHDAGLQSFIDKTSTDTGVAKSDLLKKARRYFKEIAAHFDSDFIKILDFALGFVFHRLYDGIFWNSSEVAQLRKASLKGPLILLPTHKSHMDYLVLSYVLYQEGLMPPHIAAGANLSFFPLGSIFRRGGAYFIRRQFKGDPLYTKMVRAYLNRLLKEGFTQEFFIEGGRTRTGKTLPPKLGLLSIYIDCLCSETFQDAVFVPISISYERIVESQSYEEEQAGKSKTAESAKGLIASTQVLLKRFGRVFVSFDKPIILSEFMAAKKFDPHTQSQEEKRRFIKSLANHVIAGMNESVTVTPASIIALVLLSSKTRAMRKDRFLAHTLDVLGMLQAAYPEIRLSEALLHDTENSLESALHLLSQDGQIVRRESKNLSYVLAPANKARSLNFYKNTIIHFFVSDALIACAFLAQSRQDPQGQVLTQAVRERVLALSQIFKFEFAFAPLLSFDQIFSMRLEFLKERHIFVELGDKLLLNSTRQAEEDLDFLSRLLHPFFESYFVVFDVALGDETLKISDRELITTSLKHLGDGLKSGLITRPEAANKQSCETATLFIRSLSSRRDLVSRFKAVTDVLDALE